MSDDALAEPTPDPPASTEGEHWTHTVQRQNDRDIFLICLAVVVAALLLDVTPARDGVSVLGAQLPEVCGMKRMGWGECPGCGLTRSFVLGSRLRPEAFRLHPAGPILLLVVVGQLPYRAGRWWRRRRRRLAGLPPTDDMRYEPYWRVFRWGLIAVILAGWLLKVWLRA